MSQVPGPHQPVPAEGIARSRSRSTQQSRVLIAWGSGVRRRPVLCRPAPDSERQQSPPPPRSERPRARSDGEGRSLPTAERRQASSTAPASPARSPRRLPP